MTHILAIDPGTEQSAFVFFDGRRVSACDVLPNNELLCLLQNSEVKTRPYTIAFEEVECYGMPVGREVFQTVWWTGRMWEASSRLCECEFVKRREVKLHLCGSPRAKDANIRQALLDRFGPGKAALGNKKAPGPLYGVSGHCWAALAVAVTWWDQSGIGRKP